MYTINLILDPNGLHLEILVGRFSELVTLAKILEIVETFQNLGMYVETDDESPLCYWLNNNDGEAIIYVLTKKINN